MKKNILIVDDEPNIIMALDFALKKKGYTVFIARDGLEAMELLQEHTVHVVILDIMMPNVDGYGVLQFIKSKDTLKEVKVIFLSAKSKESDLQKGLELGADHYVTKPFVMKELLLTVKDLVS